MILVGVYRNLNMSSNYITMTSSVWCQIIIIIDRWMVSDYNNYRQMVLLTGTGPYTHKVYYRVKNLIIGLFRV